MSQKQNHPQHSKSKIYSTIKGNKGYKLISFSKLKEENKELFLILESKTIHY